jgi:acyl-CoA hydrolase
MSDVPVQLPDREPALRVVPMPADANHNGDIFGGWIMSQVDIAGSIPASRRAAAGSRPSPSIRSCSSSRWKSATW